MLNQTRGRLTILSLAAVVSFAAAVGFLRLQPEQNPIRSIASLVADQPDASASGSIKVGPFQELTIPYLCVGGSIRVS